MARIRTIKPEMAKHEGLFDLEQETGLPIRFAWAMLFTACDCEGRFQWRPRTLKADILPHDLIEFSRVLDAWLTRGFIVRYRVGSEWFGWVPTFRKHQVINNRETASVLPGVELADEVVDLRIQQLADASRTREARVDDGEATRQVHAQGEGKGREGEGKGKEPSSLRSDSSSPAASTPLPTAGQEGGTLSLVPPSPAKPKASIADRVRQIATDAQAAYNAILAKPNGLLPLCAVINKPRLKAVEKALPTVRQICLQAYGSERVTPKFWQQYFAVAADDDFHAGRRKGGEGHENWTPDFEFLLRETTIAKLFDRAMSEQAEKAA